MVKYMSFHVNFNRELHTVCLYNFFRTLSHVLKLNTLPACCLIGYLPLSHLLINKKHRTLTGGNKTKSNFELKLFYIFLRQCALYICVFYTCRKLQFHFSNKSEPLDQIFWLLVALESQKHKSCNQTHHLKSEITCFKQIKSEY